MPAGRIRQSLGDYLAIAISPVLIMALVGSLVFFLVEVLYAGRYEGRLRWMLFCFVFGAVLIARISMTGGIAERAKLYGLVLGVAVYIALWRFVTFPPGTVLAPFAWAVNLGLMAIIWWCAHRLTWDCTLIDDATEASGAGLLEAAGLDAEASPEEPVRVKRKKSAVPQFGLMAWWDRYQTYREAQAERPRNPGVWIVYFSLAALPLFGLGQSLIPPTDAARRRYAFWLMGIYVASGLGLLLSTCYLGLRRYLRQRKLRMPVAMTGLWLLMGGGLIAALLVTAAVLPRPNAEYAIVNLKSLAGSKERKASRQAVKGDSPTRGEGRGSNQRSADQQQQGKEGKGGNKDEHAKNQRGGKGKGNSTSGQKANGKGQAKGKSRASGKGRDDQQRQQKSGPSGSTDPDDQHSKDTNGSDSTSSDSSPLLSHLSTAGTVLKWVVFGIVAAVVVFLFLRSGLKWLANFTDWARRLLETLRNFWAALFGGRGEEEREEEAAATVARARAPRPFAAFRNPFLTGAAERLPPEELVRYSFEALEALAREHEVGRAPDETPLEFVRHLADGLPTLEAEARGLAALYVRAAYADGRLPASCVETIRLFWDRLEAAAESPVSA